MTISELYAHFCQDNQWKSLAVASRKLVSDILLKPYGHTDADTITREQLVQWLQDSGRVPSDTIPLQSVITHMMQWAGKWQPEDADPQPKKRASTVRKPKRIPRKATSTIKAKPIHKPRTPNAEKKQNSVAPKVDEKPEPAIPEPDEQPQSVATESKKPTKQKRMTHHPEREGDVQIPRRKKDIELTPEEWQADTRTRTGTVSYNASSRGWQNGKRKTDGRWQACIMINGQRYRHRGNSPEECRAWLRAVTDKKILPTDNAADWLRMEQRKDEQARADEMVVSALEEAHMIYEYRQTGDMKILCDYCQNALLPHMVYYCARMLNMGQERALNCSRQAVGLLLTRIACGRPITNITFTCKRMIRVYKNRGNFFYYETAPDPVRLMVNRLDMTALAEVYKVTRDRRL